MKGSAALHPIVLAVVALVLAPRGAQAQSAQEPGPIEITACQTINDPGSYKLVNNLTFSAFSGTCLPITVSFVTIDLAGFTISGSGAPHAATEAIAAQPSSGQLRGITVRNGSISGFTHGVDLSSAGGSIVEGLRVSGPGAARGIEANGIVKGNTVLDIFDFLSVTATNFGISATGIVTDNYVSGSQSAQYEIGRGSTVIGNTAGAGPRAIGFDVICPSNVTNNTAIGNLHNLRLLGTGCNDTNNVAP
jgi:hypothetical protein